MSPRCALQHAILHGRGCTAPDQVSWHPLREALIALCEIAHISSVCLDMAMMVIGMWHTRAVWCIWSALHFELQLTLPVSAESVLLWTVAACPDI